MSGDSNYQRLCIVTAVDIEFKIASGLLSKQSFSESSQVCRGTTGNRQITVLKSGMGAPGFTDRLERHLKYDSYDAVIAAGLAGGLDPKLKTGDAVVYTLCRDARSQNSKEIAPDCDEIASIVLDNRLSGFVFETLRASGVSSILGDGITVSSVVTESVEKQAIGLCYDAKAVDMETFEVGLVCKDYGAPMTALRVILDDANADIPDFNRGYKENGRANRAQMAAVLLAKPAVTARFLRDLRTAVRSLKKSLKAIYDA